MLNLVQFQNMIVTKTFSTKVATVWFLSGVCSGVYLELLGAGEPFLTTVADVWFLSGVCSQVDNELTALDKGFVALSTFVRALPGVGSHVSVQFPRMLE